MHKLPVLLLIDVQQGFDSPYWGSRNNMGAEANMSRLLNHWRQNGLPVVHIQHMSQEPNSPLRPDQPGNEFKDEVKPLPGEQIVRKTVNSGFIGTALEDYLRDHKFQTLVLAGLTTDHCVSTTVRMAANLGFETFVVSDATATFNRTGHDGKPYSAEEMHAVALASLHGEFATVLNTGQMLEKLQEALV